MERRKPKIKIGRRRSDIPVVVLDQFKKEMKEHVAETIEKVVNGGIRKIDTNLTNHITSDKQWKDEAKPALDNMRNLTSTGKLIVSLSMGITAIGGAVLILRKFFLGL